MKLSEQIVDKESAELGFDLCYQRGTLKRVTDQLTPGIMYKILRGERKK